jgi:hypothetical protein
MKKRKAIVEQHVIEFAFSLRDGERRSWACYHQLKHPVLNALLDACGDRWNRLLELLAKLQQHPRARTPRVWRQVVQLSREFYRLAVWAFVENRASPVDGVIRIARFVENEGRVQLRLQGRPRKSPSLPALRVNVVPSSPDAGYSFGAMAIEADINVAPRPGAPATQREIAIRALELRLSEQTAWPWSRLATKLCRCPAMSHGSRCQQNLRREVLHLKRLLAEFNIDVNRIHSSSNSS